MKEEWTDKIRNMANMHQEHVPEYIWENVKPHLPQKKRNRFWFIPIICMGLTIGMFLYKGSNSIQPTKSSSAWRNDQELPLQNSTNQNKINDLTHEYTSASQNSLPASIYDDEGLAKKAELKHTSNVLKPNSQEGLRARNISEEEKSLVSESETFIRHEDKQQIEIEVEALDPKQPELLGIQTLKKLNKGIDCYSFSGKASKWWAIEAYIGPGYSPFTLNEQASEMSNYISARRNSEKENVSSIAGVRLAYHLKNWTFRAGFAGQQIYEQFNYVNNDDYRIVAVYEDSVLIRLDTIPGTRIVKTHNYHRMIHIPLSIAYGVRVGRSSLSIQPGIGINLFATHKGTMFQPNLQRNGFTTGSGSGFEVYRTNVGLFASLDVNWFMPVYNRIGFFIEPGLMYFLNPFNTSDLPVNENYISTNVKFGLSYRIN
ncbi:MAG: hypothetical protein IPM48_00745 [Saprospiraceae bacterium]|nr:hypothetical protein [Saprospiraceae bacterium]